MHLTHVINTDQFKDKELQRAQAITFKSIEVALQYLTEGLTVQIVAASSSSDLSYLPAFIKHYKVLDRSILDVVKEHRGRNLPLLADVLDCVKCVDQTDYLIYTNIDIALMPYFYQAIHGMIKAGHEGCIINRRRISSEFLNEAHPISELYAQVGDIHPGYDCFVFKRTDLDRFFLGNICIGIPHIGNTLAHNLFAFSHNFILKTDLHLTFHVGMDLVKKWGPSILHKHNYVQFRKALEALKPHFRIEQFPGAYEGFFCRHFKWLMNPTLHYPTMLQMDLQSFRWRRRSSSVRLRRERDNRYYEWLLKKVNF